MNRYIARTITAVAMGAAASLSLISPAQAASPNCDSGKSATSRYGGWSLCTNRTHRVALYCQTQQGEKVVFGPWKQPGSGKSNAICQHATRSFTVWYDIAE